MSRNADKRFRTCRFKGCKRRPTDKAISFSIRSAGREGRKAGGLERAVSAVVCERHANVLLNRLLGALEEPVAAPVEAPLVEAAV